jgi:PAS domain S-box-containing protein
LDWEIPAGDEVSKQQKPIKDLNRVLLDLVHNIGQASDLEGALAACLDGAGHMVPCDGISVMWLEGDHFEILASAGSTAPLSGLTLPASQMGAARAVLDGGRVVAVDDVMEDARWQRVPGEEQVRAWLGAPLQLGERIIGLLEWTAAEPGRFDGDDIHVAEEIAHYVVSSLHRAQLLEDTRLRLRELIEPRLASTPKATDLGEELQPVVDEALDFMAARHAFVFLLGDGNRRLRCVTASGDRPEQFMHIALRGDGTLGGWSIPISGSTERLGAGPSDREIMASIGIETTLIMPLRVGKEQIGMLGVAEPQRGRTFGRDSMRLMTHLASQASLVVERVHHNRRDSERYDYELVVRSSPLGVGALTVTGDIRVCNPAMSGMLSRSDRRLVGRNLADFLTPADGRRLVHALEEVAITGQRQQVDVRIPSAQGDPRHARISLALAHVSDDAGGNLVAMMEDITPLKILEQERVEHLRELREKHALLQELDQVKSRFVSNVSHELRTPLAVIKLYATLARKGRPEKQAYYLQTIEQETHRLETMVENILDLTRMDRHTLRVHAEWLAPEEVIDQVLEVYQEAARKQGVELRNHVRGDLPRLWADKNHLIQMLTNLIDNALKYTPRDGQVWVAARNVELDSQEMLEIAVGDTGAGIADDEQERVFDRFYRGSNNTPGSTGTGLGLAIVRELMVQHGGRVTLTSQLDQGSTFALQFPLTDPADQPEAQ